MAAMQAAATGGAATTRHDGVGSLLGASSEGNASRPNEPTDVADLPRSESGGGPSSSSAAANGRGSLKAETSDGPAPSAGPVVTEREMHVVASIEEWNRGLNAATAASKFRMLGQSPIAFFSGTNHLFWADLSGDPHLTKFGNSRTTTWICGNCTYLAFASAGSDAEGPLYGVNGFEEALVADYQYDVWRLAVSIALLVRERLGHFPREDSGTGPESLELMQASAVKAMAKGYLEAIYAFRAPGETGAGGERRRGTLGRPGGSGMGGVVSSPGPSRSSSTGKLSRLLALTGGNPKGLLVRFLAIVERDLSRRKLIKKWCGDVSSLDKGARVSFLTKPGSVEPCPQYEADAVVAALGSQYADGVNVKALARRLDVSPATCGLPRFIALTETADRELHILDLCMQHRPTAYHFMNPGERSAYLAQFRNEAHRYAAGCQALSLADESSTSWVALEGAGLHPAACGAFSVRDCSPFQEEYPVAVPDDAVKAKLRPFAVSSREALLEISATWGRILGAQHSHAAVALEEQLLGPSEAGRQPGFNAAIAALVKEHNGGFEDLACQIAVAYSRQVVHDWQVFLRYVLSRD